MVDVELLCVLVGKWVWVVMCVVMILAYDGNLAGVASLAVCGLLMMYCCFECVVDLNIGMVIVYSVDV